MANPFTEYTGSMGAGISGIVSSTTNLILKAVVVVVVLSAVIFYIMNRKKKKQMNIPVTIWIPRSDGKITDEITAKGGYFRLKQSEGGYITVFRLKRKGLASIELPPPSSRFLVGLSRKLYLIQKGPDDFEAVLPESFREVITARGDKIAMIDLKCINQDATAWVEDIRENSKKRFTLHGFWERYKDFIQITIFIFIVMISMYINWQGLKDVAGALQSVASQLSPSAPVIT